MAQHTLGNAAQQDIADDIAAMRAHDDEVGGPVFGRLHDHGRGLAGPDKFKRRRRGGRARGKGMEKVLCLALRHGLPLFARDARVHGDAHHGGVHHRNECDLRADLPGEIERGIGGMRGKGAFIHCDQNFFEVHDAHLAGTKQRISILFAIPQGSAGRHNTSRPAPSSGATRHARDPYTTGMKLTGDELVALLVAISFAAGLNLYATVATLGLLAHAGVLALPPGLTLLASWWVIGASGALFGVEFFADKVPAFDLLWNALHTFIRVPAAALLAYKATVALSPGEQLAAAAVGGLIALVAHGGKTAVRAAVTPSPEPLSNIGLSLGEDTLAVFLTWMATVHPYWAAGIATGLVVVTILLVRWVVRALRALFRGAERAL